MNEVTRSAIFAILGFLAAGLGVAEIARWKRILDEEAEREEDYVRRHA